MFDRRLGRLQRQSWAAFIAADRGEVSSDAIAAFVGRRAVLRAAREMTLDLAVSDETFAALRQGLDNERLTDLIVTISFYNGLVRLLETMQVDVEEDYLPYLDQLPLPKP